MEVILAPGRSPSSEAGFIRVATYAVELHHSGIIQNQYEATEKPEIVCWMACAVSLTLLLYSYASSSKPSTRERILVISERCR
jgi:hypothetical protein